MLLTRAGNLLVDWTNQGVDYSLSANGDIQLGSFLSDVCVVVYFLLQYFILAG